MAGFRTLGEIVTAQRDTGDELYVTWRKAPTQSTSAGNWFDLSMSPSNPSAQYYAASPLVATQLKRSTDGGLNHGGAVSPKKKYLRKSTAIARVVGPTPINMVLCDYLLFYPFVDESVTDEQLMDNSVTLPRYTDGDGVQMMAVVVAAQVGGGTFTVNYTNSDGVSGRTSKPMRLSTTGKVNGVILTSGRTTLAGGSAFIALQNGDSGVRSVEGVTCSAPDIGLFALVLVRPLAQSSIPGIDAPVEIDYLTNFSNMPEIQDDAYLNWICCPMGNLSASSNTLLGDLTFVWK